VYPRSIGYVRNHFVNFKVDLDIYGPANRVEYLKLENAGEKHPDLADPSETVYVWNLKRALKEYEKDTEYRHTLSQPKYLLVTNANATNRYGNPRSYRILPLTMSKLMMPDKHVISKAISWAKNPVTTLLLASLFDRPSSLSSSSSSSFSYPDSIINACAYSFHVLVVSTVESFTSCYCVIR